MATMMKHVALLGLLGLASFVWTADAGMIGPGQLDSAKIEKVFHNIFKLDASESKKKLAPEVFVIAKPCIERRLGQMNTEFLGVLQSFFETFEQCAESAKGNADEQNTLVTCIEAKFGDEVTDENFGIFVLGEIFEECIEESVAKFKQTSPEAAAALA